MAMSASVTVFMAAETIGVLMGNVAENREVMLTSGKHFRISRDQQDVIECESFGLNFIPQ